MAAVLATDFESLAEVERQTALRVNGRTNHQRGPGYKLGWEIPPNIERASASRDKKSPAKTVTKPKPAPVEAPAIVQPSIEINGRVLASIDDYDGLWNAIRQRVDALAITRLELDHLSGNQEGYSGKVLGPGQIKKFGKRSLGNTLGAVGSYLALVEDPEQVAKLKAVIEALSALCAAAALGVTRKEFEQIAGFAAAPTRTGIGSLGDALGSAGCKLILVENAADTAKIMARCRLRQRPLRPPRG